MEITTSLRDRGLRVTSQRRAILAAFLGQRGDHLTADEIFQRARTELPELARATVYNTLGELVRVGLLRVVETPGAVRYEQNLDDHHHHFRCLGCGRLYDVHPEGVARLGLVAEGFEVEQTKILLEGWCPTCERSG